MIQSSTSGAGAECLPQHHTRGLRPQLHCGCSSGGPPALWFSVLRLGLGSETTFLCSDFTLGLQTECRVSL